MNKSRPEERIRFWRIPGLGDLELLQARYRRQNFGPHFHEGFVVGVIEAGALGYRYQGRDHVASAGEINLCLPGEVHNGFAAAGSGWQYRMFYFSPGYVERLTSSPDSEPALIRIRAGKIQDPDLAKRLWAVHCSLENPDLPLLEQESALARVLTDLLARHAEARSGPYPAGHEYPKGHEPLSVGRAREYIRAHHEENISLADLSLLTGLSRFHLLRVFKNAIGLTPHAFLLQVRFNRARDLLARGEPIAQAALESGFFDQSHLNRVFKRIYGVTPGVFRNNIQDPLSLS